MPVNNGNVAEQAYAYINAIHDQATGETTLAPLNHEQFVSIAQKTLAAGYEPVLNAISTVLSRTLIAVRPYERKLAGMEATTERWGGWMRKLNFGDTAVEEDQGYKLVDGQSIDPYVVKKIPILETCYLGADTWQDHYSVPKDQLNASFQSEQGLYDLISGMALHFNNLREQHLENFARQTLAALMLGRKASETANASSVVHLVTEYNGKTGGSYTLEDLMKPDMIRGFYQFVIGRVAGISRRMTERSQLYQNKITGYKINRHTPRADQKVYLLADVMETIASQVESNTFNEEFLSIPDHESVSFWQSIDSPDKISGVPPMIAADGTLTTGTQTAVSDVFGIILDRDAAGYNVFVDEMEPVMYNSAGRYWNFYHSIKAQSQVDLTEKSVLLMLD